VVTSAQQRAAADYLAQSYGISQRRAVPSPFDASLSAPAPRG
jgi:hypothetical protein